MLIKLTILLGNLNIKMIIRKNIFNNFKWLNEQHKYFIISADYDGLICASTDPEVFDQDLEISKAVSLTKSTSCRILAESGTSLVKRRDAKPTAKLLWAAAANGYHQGAAGGGLHDMVRRQELTF